MFQEIFQAVRRVFADEVSAGQGKVSCFPRLRRMEVQFTQCHSNLMDVNHLTLNFHCLRQQYDDLLVKLTPVLIAVQLPSRNPDLLSDVPQAELETALTKDELIVYCQSRRTFYARPNSSFFSATRRLSRSFRRSRRLTL